MYSYLYIVIKLNNMSKEIKQLIVGVVLFILLFIVSSLHGEKVKEDRQIDSISETSQQTFTREEVLNIIKQ